MKYFFKKSILFFILTSNIFLFYGCKDDNNNSEDIKNEIEQHKQNVLNDYNNKNKNDKKVESLEGLSKSPFTGLYIDENIANKRPIAVTINNLHKALPQSGISQADMYFENLAEGEITRIIAIFQNYTSEKIGPVRSTREYFSYYPLDTDAIYIHHGGSNGGYEALKKRGVNAIDGMYDTTAFYRDKKRANTSGMYEHSSYISSDGVNKSIQNNGFRTEYKGTPLFNFYDESNIISNGIDAVNISIPYSYYQNSEFKYNKETNLYERYQSGQPQIDEETGEILTVSNVIIQYANTYVIDSEGRREIDLVGKGTGQVFYGGKYHNVTWNKSDYKSQTQWYDENGNKLTLNPGKTWVCVVPLDTQPLITP